MTPEQLMKPRYKVIADYPKSIYEVGTVLNAGMTSEDLIYCDWSGPRMRDYPHLFKKLEWWEERQPDEMPEYVKGICTGEVDKVTRYSIGLPVYYTKSTYKSKFGVIPEPFNIRAVIPATREEFEAQQNSPCKP